MGEKWEESIESAILYLGQVLFGAFEANNCASQTIVLTIK